MDVRLDDKVAVVTGAASGMGKAIAETMAQSGARVLAADIAIDRLEDAFAGNAAVTTCGVDMADAASVTAMIGKAVGVLGTVDVLVNNAGIMDLFEGVASLDLDVWRHVMAINLEGPMHAMRAALPVMLARGSGSIVNICSTAAVSGAAAGCAYTASKHGLLGLTRSTAWIYADRGIRCNAVLPGSTATNIRESMTGRIDEVSLARLMPFHNIAPGQLQPQDIANIVLMLASDATRMINGAEIAADAGLTAA